MADGTALTAPPVAAPEDWTSASSAYGFHCETWLDSPHTSGPDWFTHEERSRRDANAYAYRQKGTKGNWYRYISLGFFVFEDCFECDKLWEQFETDPLQVHRSIWYNFRFHIDQNMNIPPKLNDWALNVSRAYLSHFDPTTLYETDTLAYSWKTMPFMTSMEVEDKVAWIPVPGRRRSKSPPTEPEGDSRPQKQSTTFPLPMPALVNLSNSQNPPRSAPKQRSPPKKPRLQQQSWSQGLPPVTTVTEDDEESEDGKIRASDILEVETLSKSFSGPQSKSSPYKTVATNDGTHRVTVKWTPPERTHKYEGDKKKLHDSIYEIISNMLPSDVGILYRWESEDLVASQSVSAMTASELRDFISPVVTFLHAQQRIVFGLRVGFVTTPGQWMRSEDTITFFKSQQIDVSISNSKSNSGRMVTAGYVLLKAPNTTHLSRYTQFLRSVLPENTPYFDVVRHKHTPMDQLIPHLRIQCGEKHVTPLCQALLPVLTGRGSAMFIPRYALGTMSEDKIKSLFQFHEKWARSLKAIPMSPQVNHLDQRRTEFNGDGTTCERSAREWMSTIMAPDNTSPALCDVVNGPPDHKAYLLVPSHYFDVANRAWRHYKSSLYPPSHREARFRDNLPGLPDVIHIQAEMQAHVSFFEQLSTASVWQQAPKYTQLQSTGGSNDDNGARFSKAQRRSTPRSSWPTPAEQSQTTQLRGDRTKLPGPPGRADDVEVQSASGQTSLGTEDGSTASTHSLTRASRTSVMTDTRFQELEQSTQRKLHALEVSSKKSADQLLSMEHQLKRIDDLDQQVTAVSDKLDLATAQMKEAHQTQQQMSVDMETIKEYTAQQFDVLNQRLLSNMESQHTMSTTILDLREHFAKMSTFMENLANKMEFDRKHPSTNPQSHIGPTDSGISQAAHHAGLLSHDSCSTSSSSSCSGSSKSKASVQSTASSMALHSPEKKKLRSTNNGPDQLRRASCEQHLSDGIEVPPRQDFMDVCANLEDAFTHQDDTQGQLTQEEHPRPTASVNPSPVLEQHTHLHPAPLDPQYKLSSDLAGADGE